AHPVVPVRRAAQLVTRVIVDHVDRAAVVVAVALSARPGMRRRARAVVHDLHVGLGAAGVAVAALVPGAVVGAVVPAMMLAAGAVVAPALMPAVVAAVPAVAAMAVAGGFGRRRGSAEADQGGEGQCNQVRAHGSAPGG